MRFISKLAKKFGEQVHVILQIEWFNIASNVKYYLKR